MIMLSSGRFLISLPGSWAMEKTTRCIAASSSAELCPSKLSIGLNALLFCYCLFPGSDVGFGVLEEVGEVPVPPEKVAGGCLRSEVTYRKAR
jgi:hypothetical protein